MHIIAPALISIYNLPFETAAFPKRIQKAKIRVINKRRDINSLSNYRPISILFVFPIEIQNIIHLRATRFFEKHSTLPDAPCGFRKRHATEAAWFRRKELIIDTFEEK